MGASAYRIPRRRPAAPGVFPAAVRMGWRRAAILLVSQRKHEMPNMPMVQSCFDWVPVSGPHPAAERAYDDKWSVLGIEVSWGMYMGVVHTIEDDIKASG